MFVAQHLLHHKAAGGKITVDDEFRRFAQHDLGHFAVEPAAQVTPARLLFVVIAGVDDVAPLVELLQQPVDLIGRGLAVVVQADDDIAAALVEARHQRRMLAEIARQVDALDMRVGRDQAADRAQGVVGRAIVDKDDLIVILRQRFHFGRDLGHDLRERMLRPVARDHVGDFLHSVSLLYSCAASGRS